MGTSYIIRHQWNSDQRLTMALRRTNTRTHACTRTHTRAGMLIKLLFLTEGLCVCVRACTGVCVCVGILSSFSESNKLAVSRDFLRGKRGKLFWTFHTIKTRSVWSGSKICCQYVMNKKNKSKEKKVYLVFEVDVVPWPDLCFVIFRFLRGMEMQ